MKMTGQRRTSAGRGVVSAGIGIAAVLGVSACATPVTPPSASAAPTAAAEGHKSDKAKGIVGQITAENGTNWTVVTPRGRSFAVTVTPQTTFGSKKAPITEALLTTGMTVRVLGTPTDATITAVRIVVPAHAAGSAAAPSAAPAGAPAAAPTAPTAPA